MDQINSKKEQFAKQKALFSQKMAQENLDVVKFIKKGVVALAKTKEADLNVTSQQTLNSKGVVLDRDAFKQLNQKLQDFKQENLEAEIFKNLTFASTIKKGDQFATIKNLKCLFENKTEQLEHKQGMVYLIDFWATWCGPCQRPMQHNQEMLEKNAEKWKDKVEIYGVSLDENLDDIKKRVETKNWKLIHHYQNKEEENLSIFEIDGIPTIYIIDQQGKVAYYGHPMSIDAEEFINKLLEKGVEEKPKKERMTKEKFNEMKAEVKEFLQKSITKEDKFNLKIEFMKKKVFDCKWNVLEKKYNYPTLSYDTMLKHNEKLQTIFKELFEKFPKTQFKIVKEQVIDKNAATQNCIKFVTSELLEKGLTANPTLSLIQQQKLKFTTREKQGLLKKNQKLQFSSEKPFAPSQAEKVKEFNEVLQQFKQKAKFPEDVQMIRSFAAQAKISVDDPFCPIKGYKVQLPAPVEKPEQEQESKEKIENPEKEQESKENPEKEQENKEKVEIPREIMTIEHIPGEVLLVDFWATWCPPCQGPMQHNQDMLTKHKDDWNKKVRIVAASLDQEEVAVVGRVKEKNWIDMEHIILNSEEFQQSPRLYGIRGIPFIVIVNKQGKIKYMGHPSSIKPEEFLQKLLDEEENKEEEKKEEEQKKPKGVITEEQFNKIVAIQKEYLPILREKIKDEKFGPIIMLKLAKQIMYDLQGNIVGQSTFIAKLFSIKMYEKQYNQFKEFEEFVEKVTNIVKKEDFEAEFKMELEKCIDIEFGKECDNCKKVLTPADKQYYCHFHKVWFCYECGNKVDEAKKGNAKYIHPCNMVYINVINDSGMKSIDEYKFGKNVQFEENDQVHSYCCNGCNGSGVERYICLTSGPMRPGGFVDLCEHCLKVLEERDLENDKYKSVHERVYNEEKHGEQTHILLRVLFGKGNYYKF